MKNRIFTGLVLLQFFSASAWSQVDVYVGYMDEEVTDVLANLIKNNPNRPVIVVERGSEADAIKNHRLFEKPMSYYGGQSPTTVVTSGAIPAGTSPEADLARNIKAATDTPEFRAKVADGVIGLKSKTVNGAKVDTSSVVMRFNPNAPPENPIILIRSPEMGLQPDMVRTQLSPLIESATSLKQAQPIHGGAHGSIFGTGGAVHDTVLPGGKAKVNASVYVGVEKIPGSKPEKFRGVVAYIKEGQKEPTYFYQSATQFADRKAAEEAASAEFAKSGGALKAKAGPGSVTGATLGDTVAAGQKGGGKTSLSVSFFGGEEVKKAGAALKIENVNMEDYHSLRTTESLAHPFDSVSTMRLACDPHSIPDSFVKQAGDFARNKKYRADDYVDAILWGLDGSKSHEIPLSGKWDLFKGAENEKLIGKLAVPAHFKDGVGVLDPFFAEIATDFLKDASKGGLFNSVTTLEDGTKVINEHAMISAKITDKLSAAELKALDGILVDHSKSIADKVNSILKATRNGVPKDQKAFLALREEIRAVIQETQNFIVPDGPLRKRMGEILRQDAAASLAKAETKALSPEIRALYRKEAGNLTAKADFLANNGRVRLLGASNDVSISADAKMEIWTRMEKWPGNQRARTLDHMMGERRAMLRESDPKMASGSSEAGHALASDEVERALNVGKDPELAGAAVDRMLFKDGIAVGTPEVAAVRVQDEALRMAEEGRRIRITALEARYGSAEQKALIGLLGGLCGIGGVAGAAK